MLFSNKYSRRFIWSRLSVEPGQNLIAVTQRLFTVSHRTQTAVFHLSLSESLQISQSLRYCTMISFDSNPCAVVICAFDKVSGKVLVGKDTTTLKSHSFGCYRVLDEIFRTSSISLVPTCFYTGTGSQPEHELNDKQQMTTTIV